MEWISVDERLPEKVGENDIVYVLGYCGLEWPPYFPVEYDLVTKEFLTCDEITHWMIPEPPK